MKQDNINHPSHYKQHASGIECITITEKMSFNVGNAFKYLYRCTSKGNMVEDLKKAQWYINRELLNRQNLRFAWFFENENYDAEFDGCAPIRDLLTFEFRFNGWMKQALERLYTASRQGRGVLALEAAATCVANMLQIQQHREGGAL